MKITTKDTFGKENTYEVVNKMPSGYIVWNIGRNMGTDEYIPICLPMSEPGKEYHIIPESVRAIKLPKSWVMTLRDAAHNGCGNLQETLKKCKSPDMLAEKALRIYKVISEGYVPESDYVKSGEWQYHELSVVRKRDKKAMTLTQRTLISQGDYYSIHRTVCNYDNSFVYEVSFINGSVKGSVLSTVYVDEETLMHILGYNLEALLWKDVATILSKAFLEKEGGSIKLQSVEYYG